MRYQQPVIIGACVLAFGAAVAFILPPTKPIGGAKVVSTANQGFSPIKSVPPAEPPTVAPTYPSDTPSTIAQSSAVAEPVAPSNVVDADEPRGSDVVNTQPPQSFAAQMPSRPARVRPTMAADRPAPRYGYADDEEPDLSGRDYKQGYRWARRADVQSPRDCRVLVGAQIDGCHAYLRDSREGPDDEGDERPY